MKKCANRIKKFNLDKNCKLKANRSIFLANDFVIWFYGGLLGIQNVRLSAGAVE